MVNKARAGRPWLQAAADWLAGGARATNQRAGGRSLGRDGGARRRATITECVRVCVCVCVLAGGGVGERMLACLLEDETD